MGRIVLRVGLAVAAVFAALLGAVAWRNHTLGERLVEDVRRLSADWPRPVHRQPAGEGTFQSCLGPLLDAAPDGGLLELPRPDAGAELIAGVRDGSLPVEALGPERRAEVQRLLPWVDGVLACTRAPAHGDAPGLGLFADWEHPRQKAGVLLVSATQRVVLLALREELARGDHHGALDRCADLLALARDMARDRGLIGSMMASSMAKQAGPGCAAAVERVDDGARRRFLAELAAVRVAWPTFTSTMEAERAEMQVMAFGRFLSVSQAARLTENAQGLASFDWGEEVVGTGSRAVLWLSWSTFLARHDRLAASATSATRDADLAAVDEEFDVLAWLLSQPSFLGWIGFAHRLDFSARCLDLIESAARVALAEPPLPSVTQAVVDGGVTLSVPDFDGGVVAVRLAAPRPR